MAFEDYIPNIFGGQNPQIAGLLGEEQAGQLQKQSTKSHLRRRQVRRQLQPRMRVQKELRNRAGYSKGDGVFDQGLAAELGVLA